MTFSLPAVAGLAPGPAGPAVLGLLLVAVAAVVLVASVHRRRD